MVPEAWNAISWIVWAAIAGVFVYGPVGRAIADRLRGRTAGQSPALQEQLDEVLGRLEDVQRQLAEVAERQDFAERLLTQARERGLPAGGSPPER